MQITTSIPPIRTTQSNKLVYLAKKRGDGPSCDCEYDAHCYDSFGASVCGVFRRLRVGEDEDKRNIPTVK